MKKPTILIVFVLSIAACVSSREAKTADPPPNRTDAATAAIDGVVIYEPDRRRTWRYRRYYVADRKNGHLAEAVIGLSGISVIGHSTTAKPARWTIDQKNYRFIPETVAVRTGDHVTFTNSDPHLHDVTIRQRDTTSHKVTKQDSFTLSQRQEVSQSFDDAGGTECPLTLSCRFHSAMRGWIYVFDHPFFCVTEDDGAFRLDRVPAGKHQLVMVHPAGNLRWEQAIELRAGETRRIEIRVSPDNLLVLEK